MTRFLLPIILIIASIGLFVLWTNPQYQVAKGLEVQATQYEDAVSKSEELRGLREKLLAKRNTFSPDDLAKLQKVLPDNVDNIRLIIDVNNIASRHNLSLTGFKIGDASSGSSNRSATAVGNAGTTVGSVVLGFSVAASYDNFIPFLIDLEHSERILDVEAITLKPGQTASVPAFDVTFRTYWLH
jgi:Tfp pilus assembly protein PilO